jgi:hypothetical protein
MTPPPTVLVLTPVKDAARFLPRYFENLERLTYPPERLSVGFLEGDSTDDTHARVERHLPRLRDRVRGAGLWKKDFGYRVPPGLHRADGRIQLMRRSILARSRNHLLFHALAEEEWVLWLDVDVVEYPADVIERLLATGKSIVQPHCVVEYGGATFDRNAWRQPGEVRMDALRGEGDLVRLDAVGGTMLLVRADLHRDGLVFPAFPYGRRHPKLRDERGELETEGLGLMAADMGHQCWGMPNLEIRHARV